MQLRQFLALVRCSKSSYSMPLHFRTGDVFQQEGLRRFRIAPTICSISMYDGQHLVVNSDEQTWALYYGGPQRISEQPLGKLSIQFSDLFRDGLDDNDDILREIAVGSRRATNAGWRVVSDDNGIIEDALNRLRDRLEFWRRYIVRDRLTAGA